MSCHDTYLLVDRHKTFIIRQCKQIILCCRRYYNIKNMPKREIQLRFWGAVILLCNMGLYPMGFSIIKTIEKKAMTIVIHPLSIVTAAPPPSVCIQEWEKIGRFSTGIEINNKSFCICIKNVDIQKIQNCALIAVCFLYTKFIFQTVEIILLNSVSFTTSM